VKPENSSTIAPHSHSQCLRPSRPLIPQRSKITPLSTGTAPPLANHPRPPPNLKTSIVIQEHYS
jgi:hypothetical protein